MVPYVAKQFLKYCSFFEWPHMLPNHSCLFFEWPILEVLFTVFQEYWLRQPYVNLVQICIEMAEVLNSTFKLR